MPGRLTACLLVAATLLGVLLSPSGSVVAQDVPAADAPTPVVDLLAGRTILSAPERPADLVVIVSIDGLRADAIAPALNAFAMLRRRGVSADAASTIRRSTTLASHASMLSGVDVDAHGMTWNAWRPERGRVHFPTVLQVAARAGLPAAMFVGKNKLRHLVAEDDPGVAFTVNGRGCGSVVDRATPWLRDTAAGVALLHFAGPDGAGHRRGWMSPAYQTAVADADACLQRVIDDLRARPTGLQHVLLLVTADHGGHGRSHGTALDVDRHIPWFAWGGAATRAQTITRPVSTMDTAATVLAALGLPQTPGIVGRPVTEALRPRNAVVAGAGAARPSGRPSARRGGALGRVARAPTRPIQ